jgi:hypothetical protein
MESEPGKAPKGRPKRGFWGVIQWIFLWGTIFGLSGVALVAVTNKAVIWSSSDAFCGTFCHTMTWTSAAYHHQCLRRARKLWAMPHPVRLQSCDGDGVREAVAV